jgi:hypothetical protein
MGKFKLMMRPSLIKRSPLNLFRYFRNPQGTDPCLWEQTPVCEEIPGESAGGYPPLNLPAPGLGQAQLSIIHYLLFTIFYLLSPAGALYAQNTGFSDPENPAHLVGLTLGEVFDRFGVPQGVFAVRGEEEWQDDVVFSYGDREFFFYRDRVWQLGLKSAFGVRTGENRNVIPLIMGDATLVEESYSLAPLTGWSWPMNVRFNNDSRGLITAIYIYRSDF